VVLLVGDLSSVERSDLHPAALGSLEDLMPVHYPGVQEEEIDRDYQAATLITALPFSWNYHESVEDDGWTGFEADTARRMGMFIER